VAAVSAAVAAGGAAGSGEEHSLRHGRRSLRDASPRSGAGGAAAEQHKEIKA
jgi:hypothetical protein